MTTGNNRGKRQRQRGVTLVELLVVLSIVATLLALLFPAVMKARESALLMRCSSQIKQISLATAQYHEVYNAYPAYYSFEVLNRRPQNYVSRNFSVFGRIIPYLEQTSLYNQINFQVQLFDEVTTNNFPLSETSFGSPANSTVMRTSLYVLNCPSDPSPNHQSGTKGTNYRANWGTEVGYGRNLTGPFTFFTVLSASGVTDGLSHTAAYSEKPRGDGYRTSFDPFVDMLVDVMNPDPPASYPFEYCARQPVIPANYRTTSGINWLIGGLTQTCYNHMEVPNGPTPDCVHLGTTPGKARATARSYHGTGVNVAMADGSVRFVHSSINIATWKALGTRAGGEAVTDESW